MAALGEPTPFIPQPALRSLRATVESGEDSSGAQGDSVPVSSSTSPATSSRSSTIFEDEIIDGEIEEIIREVVAAPLCRLDGAHEMALSFFGLVPPKNFGRVMPAVYRSGFPLKENLSFLKTLRLKSILTLVPEEYGEEHKRFVDDNGISHFRVRIQPNKNPFVVISQCDMAAALGVVLDQSNHPLLIHCNKGKHRTGTVVGCLRKVQGWDMERVLNEYRSYAGAKARVLDERFMDMFDERALLWLARHNGFIPDDEPMTDSPITSSIPSTRLRG